VIETSEPKKPKIKIGKPSRHPRSGAICVPYQYDTGEKGYRNFTLQQFETLDVEAIIKEHYEQTQAQKKQGYKPETKMKELEEKEIDW